MLYLGVILVTLTPAALGADLLSVASDNGCGQIVGLIQSAGLADPLKAAQGVTLFAPSDTAVGRIPSDVLSELQKNATMLAGVLKFHVVTQVVHAADISNDLLLPTLHGKDSFVRMNIYTHSKYTVVTAEGSVVTKTDLPADNGVVHVLDKVIFPLPTLNLPLTMTFNPDDLSNLAYMVYTANLIDSLTSNPFTVFAPSNAALNKIDGQLYNDWLMDLPTITKVLHTHVVKGVVFSEGMANGDTFTNMAGTTLTVTKGNDGFKVNNISVTKVDIPATNGVIHLLDAVIMPN